jgi:hypothetical protein
MTDNRLKGNWSDLYWKLIGSLLETDQIFIGNWSDLYWKLIRSLLETDRIFIGNWSDLVRIRNHDLGSRGFFWVFHVFFIPFSTLTPLYLLRSLQNTYPRSYLEEFREIARLKLEKARERSRLHATQKKRPRSPSPVWQSSKQFRTSSSTSSTHSMSRSLIV